MMIGDVTVVGMDVQTVVLGDIGMDVPSRAVVTVPADKATLSKDLWRAISQKRLFQLHSGPVSPNPVRPRVSPSLVTASTGNSDVWQERCRVLERENAQLREKLAQLQRTTPVQKADVPADKLDEILTLLRSGVPVSGSPMAPMVGRPSASVPAVVDVETPAFIPSEIRPKNIEGKVQEIQTATAENQNIGSAASALRKFRKGSPQ